MTKEPNSGKTEGGLICSWCGATFLPQSSDQGSTVCPKCLHLLRVAGVPDEEIFGPPAANEDDEG